MKTYPQIINTTIVSILVAVLVVMQSCSSYKTKYPKGVVKALREAKQNKKELIQVIEHYNKQPDDSLKLRAAYFLIANMPGKYGIYYPEDVFYFELLEKTDSLLKSPCSEFADKAIKEYLAEGDKKNSVELQEIQDLDVIKADYLIENIDLAFKVWREKPWAQHVNFDDFCESILPYRLSTEPLQRWRPYLLSQLEHYEDSLKNPSDPKELTTLINMEIGNRFIYTNKLNFMPLLGGVDIWKLKGGVCVHSYLVATLAMRSVGLPIRKDFTHKFAVWPGKHTWIVLLDKDGIKPFDGGAKKMKFFDPPNCPNWYEGIALVTTVFRETFANNTNPLLGVSSKLPFNLLTHNAYEVSHEYDTSNRGDVEVDIIPENTAEYAVLYAFDEGAELVAVTCTKINDGKAVFKNIQYSGVYVVGMKSDKGILYNNQPFLWHKQYKKIYYTPDTTKLRTYKLYRKYPPQGREAEFIKNTLGARIEASNNEQFNNADELYTISNVQEFSPVELKINSNQKYRYYRYLPVDTCPINIAELVLYTMDNEGNKKKILGDVFGHISQLPYCNEGILKNINDNNIASNLNAPESSWVGIDAGEPVKLESIRVIARSHLNYIEPGDTYELKYFNKGWRSLGTKIATDYELEYDNLPSHALLLLQNKTKGKQERIFLCWNNIQVWK